MCVCRCVYGCVCGACGVRIGFNMCFSRLETIEELLVENNVKLVVVSGVGVWARVCVFAGVCCFVCVDVCVCVCICYFNAFLDLKQ